MERFKRNSKELQRIYQANDMMSAKATAQRKKVRDLYVEVEAGEATEVSREAAERLWRTAYYEPINRLRRQRDVSSQLRDLSIRICTGEMFSLALDGGKHAAYWNGCIGDMHRYLSDEWSQQQARGFYERAVYTDPDWGQPYNQLALLSAQHPVQAMRLFLRALLAGRPFAAASDNLLRTLAADGNFKCALTSAVSMIVYNAVAEYNRVEMEEQCGAWLEGVRARDDLLGAEQVVETAHVLVLAARMAKEGNNDDAFRHVARVLCEAYSCMLDQVECTSSSPVPVSEEGSDSEEERLPTRGRRREDSEEEEEQIPDVIDLSDEDEEEDACEGDTVDVGAVACLAAASEWATVAVEGFDEMKRRKAPLPAVLTDAYSAMLEKLVRKLNGHVRVLLSEEEEEGEGETLWLLRGPRLGTAEGGGEKAAAAAAYWASECASSEHCPILFADFFKMAKSGEESARQKMAKQRQTELLKEAELIAWLPEWVVVCGSVLESSLALLRPLTAKLPLAVSTSCLARLDQNKSSGAAPRNALRFIQRGQQQDWVRVVEGRSPLDAARLLLTECAPAEEGSVRVTVLTEESDPPQPDEIGVSASEVSEFCRRWTKEVAWRW